MTIDNLASGLLGAIIGAIVGSLLPIGWNWCTDKKDRKYASRGILVELLENLILIRVMVESGAIHSFKTGNFEKFFGRIIPILNWEETTELALTYSNAERFEALFQDYVLFVGLSLEKDYLKDMIVGLSETINNCALTLTNKILDGEALNSTINKIEIEFKSIQELICDEEKFNSSMNKWRVQIKDPRSRNPYE